MTSCKMPDEKDSANLWTDNLNGDEIPFISVLGRCFVRGMTQAVSVSTVL